MRPDEHKRKQSNQYKKKHGINNKKNTKELGPTPLTESKAKLTLNNWDRYKEPDADSDNDNTDLIGSDFNTVINAGSGSSSFMRLEKEKDWDKQEEFDDLLTIDCKALADSLQTLNFFERLGLNEKDFDPSLIEWLNENEEDTETNLKTEKIVFVDQKSFDFSKPNPDTQNPKTEPCNISDHTDFDVLNTLVQNEHSTNLNQDQVNNTEPKQTDNTLNLKSNSPDNLKASIQEKNNFQNHEKDLINKTKGASKNEVLLNSNEENPVDDLEDWLDSVI